MPLGAYSRIIYFEILHSGWAHDLKDYHEIFVNQIDSRTVGNLTRKDSDFVLGRQGSGSIIERGLVTWLITLQV